MALATYSDLKASLAGLLHRSDLTAVIPDLITLAEAEMNRQLRAAGKTRRATAIVADEYSAVPDGFDGVKTFDLATNPITPLRFLSTDQMTAQRALSPGVGKPRFFSVVGTEFRYLPVPDASYSAELTYNVKVPALSGSNASNWVLASHPDAYLYGAAMHSAPWLRDDARLTMWATLFTTILDSIITQDERASYGSPLNMRKRAY